MAILDGPHFLPHGSRDRFAEKVGEIALQSFDMDDGVHPRRFQREIQVQDYEGKKQAFIFCDGVLYQIDFIAEYPVKLGPIK